MERMQDGRFGLELEMNRITRDRAAQVIAEALGVPGSEGHLGGGYDKWAVRDQAGRRWTVVSDSSIDGPWEEQTELNTPVLGWEDIETLQKVVRALRAAGAKAHSSCGIHIHVDATEHTPASLRRLVNLTNSREELLTLALGISPARRERWCREVSPRFLDELNRKRPDTLDGLAEVWYGTADWQQRARQHYDGSRYRLLNLHSLFQGKGVEFRAFNSTLHAGEIKAYIQLCLAMSFAALTSTSASPRRPETDNPAYTFRCWLLRLKMNGEEFKTARHHLLKRLPGNAAWRHGDPTRRDGSEPHTEDPDEEQDD